MEIATTSDDVVAPGRPEPAMVRRMAYLLSGSTVAGGVATLAPGKHIAVQDRTAMEHRLAVIDRALAQRAIGVVAAAVAKMLAGYRASEHDGNKREVIAAMAEGLADLPAWVAVEVCVGWPKGRFGNEASPFAPSVAQLYAAGQNIVARYSKEAGMLRRVLGAKTQDIPEAERARVAAGLEAFKAELGGVRPDAAAVEAAAARARYEEMCRAAGVSPDDVPDQDKPLGAWGTLAKAGAIV
jgi:hypothetical protein